MLFFHFLKQSIIVHWEPPPDEAKNGIITGYKIRYKLKSKGRRGDTVTTDGNRRAYALTGGYANQNFLDNWDSVILF